MSGITEKKKLNESREQMITSENQGHYLSERQLEAVCEDYSESGDAWKGTEIYKQL